MVNIPKIRIDSQMGKIGLKINKPLQEIKQPQPVVSIEQPAAELKISNQQGKLTIDQTLARENLDLKSVFKRTEENAQTGYQSVMQYISKSVQEGNELMKIENGGNPIKEQSKRSLERSINYDTGSIPSQNSVKISYKPARVNVDIHTHAPNIEARVNKVSHQYTPGTTDVFLQQAPSLKIDFTI
jgi:hypothetical protein